MAQPIRVLIVDDEPHARAGIQKLMHAYPDFVAVGEAPDGKSAVAQVQALRPDVVFLDIQMPEMDGLAVAESIVGKDGPIIVFVTAYNCFAVHAFDLNAVDYLVKPFSDARFAETILRAKAALKTPRLEKLVAQVMNALHEFGAARGDEHDFQSDSPDHPEHITRFLIKRDDRTVVVEPRDVDWIEAASYYARIHVGPRSFLIRESLNALEARLDPDVFARTHRSAIVQLDRVVEIRAGSDGHLEVVLITGARAPLSRSRAKPFSECVKRPRSGMPA